MLGFFVSHVIGKDFDASTGRSSLRVHENFNRSVEYIWCFVNQ